MRDADGRFCVLEDNLRTPSGVSYVIENRVMMTRLMPDLIRASQVRSVEHYPADLLASLSEIAPGGNVESDGGAAYAGPLQLRVLRARVSYRSRWGSN